MTSNLNVNPILTTECYSPICGIKRVLALLLGQWLEVGSSVSFVNISSLQCFVKFYV